MKASGSEKYYELLDKCLEDTTKVGGYISTDFGHDQDFYRVSNSNILF